MKRIDITALSCIIIGVTDVDGIIAVLENTGLG